MGQRVRDASTLRQVIGNSNGPGVNASTWAWSGSGGLETAWSQGRRSRSWCRGLAGVPPGTQPRGCTAHRPAAPQRLSV